MKILLIVIFQVLLFTNVYANLGEDCIGEDCIRENFEREVLDILSETNQCNMCDTLEVVSRLLLRRPYNKQGPLGEGRKGRYYKDPRATLSSFDCTTFVETVLALSGAEDPEDFFSRMDEIRYSGDISYFNRNHFFSLDWIPHLINTGFARDITDEIVGGEDLPLATAIINKPAWYKRQLLKKKELTENQRSEILAQIEALGPKNQVQRASIPYIPTERFVSQGDKELLKKIPSGTIMSIVRPNWDLAELIGTNMNVSHVGFVIQKGGETYFRHASSSEMKVVEVPLEDYLKKFIGHKTIRGVHLLDPN